MTPTLEEAFKATPGHHQLGDGGHGGYCQLCGQEATLTPDGTWTCAGGCDPGQAGQTIVDWYQNVHLPSQRRNNGTAPQRAPKWPKLPGHEADRHAVQTYLTEAAGLPPGFRVDRATRWGSEATDPLTVWIRRDGPAKDIKVRFERQTHAGKAGLLRDTLSRALRGRVRMKHPTPAQAADFQAILCQLADLDEDADIGDETRAWLEEFLGHTRLVTGHSLADPERRYDALMALKATPEFQRVQAGDFVRRILPPDQNPALLLDEATGERWIRAGELATYLRHVYGLREPLAQTTLDSRLAEIGVERVSMEVRRSAGRHPKLVMYRLDPIEVD